MSTSGDNRVVAHIEWALYGKDVSRIRCSRRRRRPGRAEFRLSWPGKSRSWPPRLASKTAPFPANNPNAVRLRVPAARCAVLCFLAGVTSACRANKVLLFGTSSLTRINPDWKKTTAQIEAGQVLLVSAGAALYQEKSIG